MNPWNIIGWIFLFLAGVVFFFVMGFTYALTGFILFNPMLWVIGGLLVWMVKYWKSTGTGRYVNRGNGHGIYDRERDR